MVKRELWKMVFGAQWRCFVCSLWRSSCKWCCVYVSVRVSWWHARYAQLVQNEPKEKTPMDLHNFIFGQPDACCPFLSHGGDTYTSTSEIVWKCLQMFANVCQCNKLISHICHLVCTLSKLCAMALKVEEIFAGVLCIEIKWAYILGCWCEFIIKQR